jgi:uncharacterized delta-60 repeat protein
VAPPGYEALVLNSIEQQANGRLVVAGRIGPNFVNDGESAPYICRLLDNGSFDPEFGNGGCTIQRFVASSTAEAVVDMALQADGHIVVVGSALVGGIRRTAVLRLNLDGNRDLCFRDGTCTAGGVFYNPVAGDPILSIQAVDVAQDGKIVLAGSGTGAQSIDMIAVRLLPTGAVDVGFGNGGSRTVAFELGGANNDGATAVVVLPDSSIVIAGDAADSFTSRQAAVAKILQSGNIDIFFGEHGTGRMWTFYTDVSLNSVVTDLAIQDDAKIVVGGTSFLGLNSTEGDFAAWRLFISGTNDSRFGYDGRITVTAGDDPENHQLGYAIDASSDHIVLFGSRRANNQAFPKSMLVRLDIDGVFEDGFEGP